MIAANDHPDDSDQYEQELAEKIKRFRTTVHGYIDEVVSGKRIVGKKIIHACQRQLADIEKAKTDWPYRFDERKAAQAIDFFSFLQHSDGEWEGLEFKLYPWQMFIVWTLFGWVKKSNGYRRFKHAFISVARGNGKSPFAAALLLVLAAFDSPMEPRAACYTAATKSSQAAIVFDQAARYVEDSPCLTSYINVMAHKIVVPAWRTTIEKLSGDGKTADGLIIHGITRDERHEWYGNALRKLDSKIITALKKRRQSMMIDVTTAGNEDSEMWQEDYDYLSLVVDPDVPRIENDAKFIAIYEMDDDDNELDEDSWHKANPMLEYGIVKLDDLRSMALEAEWNPLKRGDLRRYHCNKFTSSAKMPIKAEVWATGNAPLPNLIGRTCYLGFDWGWKDDLASAGYVFPLDWIYDKTGKHPKRRYAILSDTWIPAGGNRQIDREPFKGWIDSGHLEVTDSEWTDTAAIYEAVELRNEMYEIKSVAFDMNNGREFGTKMVNAFGKETYAFPQSHAKYHEPLTEFIVALHEGRILHGGNPLLSWCALNLVTKENTDKLVMPWKARSADKIDPMVAILMAFSEAIFHEPDAPSVYEEIGPVLI